MYEYLSEKTITGTDKSLSITFIKSDPNTYVESVKIDFRGRCVTVPYWKWQNRVTKALKDEYGANDLTPEYCPEAENAVSMRYWTEMVYSLGK
jgi:hypothetical protein